MALREITCRERTFLISYELLNTKSPVDMVFLHGWGSNKEVMKQSFQNCFSSFRHIYIDMPGFGKSSNEWILTTQEYAQILGMFLNEIGVKATWIFGHSFGGKVATLLEPEHLVLLSSAGIPVEKSGAVKTKIWLAKLLKPVLGESVKKMFVTKDAEGLPPHMYETLKNVVDEPFQETFCRFRGTAHLFWGDSDTATPVKTGQSIHACMKNSTFHVLQGDHYFFLYQAKEIERIIRGEET